MSNSKAVHHFSHFARIVADEAGSWRAFSVALALVIAWFIGGFYVGFADQLYQLLINTGTTIVTFLMVFLLQHTQTADTVAIQAKLDELIRAVDKADDRLIGIEKKDDDVA